MRYIKNFEANNYLSIDESDKLIEKICNNNFDDVSSLLKKFKKRNINIDFNYNGGYTPLIYSIIHNCSIKLIKLLVDYGANIDQKDSGVITPLILSASRVKMDFNYLNITIFLIEAGADWNIRDKRNLDFLDYLPDDKENYILGKFRIEYDNYLIKKNADKYNL